MAKKEKGYSDPMAATKTHKEIDISASACPRGYGDDPVGAFLPRPAKDRATPHVKVNEYDY